MKFWKWITIQSEGTCEARLRSDYQQMPDKYLAQINPDELSTLGLKIYREELDRRKNRKESGDEKRKLVT